ncbi:MAG: hypothetical protein DSY82_06110 [Flavobacteriia bacterium]|nr:MAG: hypothetical protein DSY82_06110 [Flavobacteriia bacterium]
MNKLKENLTIVLLMLSIWHVSAQDQSRWSLTGDEGLQWNVKQNDSHIDHLEMSGLYISAIVHYGVEKGELKQRVHLVFPMLRTIPNDTHGSLSYDFAYDGIAKPMINGKEITEAPDFFYLKGVLKYGSKTDEGISITHQLYPTTNKPVFIDKMEFKNFSNKAVKIVLPKIDEVHYTDKEKGVEGVYRIQVVSSDDGNFVLKPHESLDYALIYSARRKEDKDVYISADYELKKREKFIRETFSDLVFESPDKILNTAFSFAKIRATESIYETKGGLMHGPGGGRYYAAIWANDQAEYANPFFPFLGNLEGNESAINSFRHFARFINDDFKPIPSSIVAEGIDIWNGRGDRGDMAMIAYGASRFSLAYGDKKTAKKLWPLITWCLEYNKRKLNKEGVVTSNTDELEGRFPSGNANLNTSSLYYDALISTVLLGIDLGVDFKVLSTYEKQSKTLKKNIEKYFGATVSGYKTYKYFKENKKLRAWIATPLTVNIYDRKEGTINALFSDKLWTVDGLASEAGSTTFWDRATLYALRGVFAAGDTDRAMNYLLKYSKRRLLGEHVPYPVEAYPEGNQRHLSAESALYCRVITEGLFDIRPTGLRKFTISPRLPEGWNKMALRHVKAFNSNFDVEVLRHREGVKIIIKENNKVIQEMTGKAGDSFTIRLSSKK